MKIIITKFSLVSWYFFPLTNKQYFFVFFRSKYHLRTLSGDLKMAVDHQTTHGQTNELTWGIYHHF